MVLCKSSNTQGTSEHVNKFNLPKESIDNLINF